MMLKSFYRLEGGVRHYAWGQCVSDGEGTPLIAELLDCAPGDDPWAELWLGAHESLPGKVHISSAEDGGERVVPLNEAIAEDPSAWLGAKASGYSKKLAFLLKVLTCHSPLSIQSHPDAESAVRLHESRPDLYPDANDKTEVIIALTEFQALAGFRGLADIVEDLEYVAAFQPWLALWRHGETTLRGLVEALFALPPVTLAMLLTNAAQELAGRELSALNGADRLFLKLGGFYPGDRGTLFAYLLNQVALHPGEALFLEPNSPHAYQHGAGIECMTNSDNVIRAGLTPKAVDVKTLLQTVDFDRTGYQMVTPQKPADAADGTLVYPTPTGKFRLFFYRDAPCRLEEHPDSVGIFLVLDGSAILRDADGRLLHAPRGTSWIRPASASAGSIEPVEPGTVVVWAQTNF